MKRYLCMMIGLTLPVLLFSQDMQLPKWEANINEMVKTTQLFKTNTIQERLSSIAIDHYSGTNWIFGDSVKYTYSGTHDDAGLSPVDIEKFFTLPDFDNMLWLHFDGVIWANYLQCTQTFDANGYKMENVLAGWSGTDWINSMRYLYSFDSEGRMETQTIQVWSGVVFENATTIEFSYNTYGLEEVNYFNWTGINWEPGNRKVYAYNGNGQLEYFTQYSWTGTDWEYQSRTVYYYTTEGLLEEYLYQFWNISVWTNSSKSTFSYNADGFVVENIRLLWNGSSWENSERITVQLDANNVPEYSIQESWDGFIWVKYYRFRYTYEDYDDGTVAVPESDISYAIKIFPNPAHRNVNVLIKSRGDALGQLEIRDVYRQLVSSMQVALHLGENLFQIDLQSMGVATGAYTLSIRTGSKTFVGKLLVQ